MVFLGYGSTDEAFLLGCVLFLPERVLFLISIVNVVPITSILPAIGIRILIQGTSVVL